MCERISLNKKLLEKVAAGLRSSSFAQATSIIKLSKHGGFY